MKSLTQFLYESLETRIPTSNSELQELLLDLVHKNIFDFNSVNVSKVTDMTFLFATSEFENINFDISKWDVSHVTNMQSMFDGCTKFNCDLSQWNTSKVTNMFRMFAGCESFEGKGLSNFDVSNVVFFGSMFYDCKKMNSDLSKWNVFKAKDMNGMFAECKIFNQDISSWDVSRVTDMPNMFKNCKSFNQDISAWDVSRVEFMTNMFEGCEKFDKDLSSWDVAYLHFGRDTFKNCKSLKKLPEWYSSEEISKN